MKTTLLFLSVFLSVISHSQITVRDLIKVAKMDRESFEIYAMNNGYSYDEIKIGEDYNKLVYRKRNGSIQSFLSYYPIYLDRKYSSGCETNNGRLLSLWYEQLRGLGFKESFEVVNDGAYNKGYIRNNNGKEEITIFIEDDWLEILYEQKN